MIFDGNIFKYQTSSDVAVYYNQSPTSQTLAKLSSAATSYSYGDNGDVFIRDGKIIAFGSAVIDVEAVGLPGVHNLQNICAAICAVWPYTQDISAIKKVIEAFTGLPYHIEHVLDKAGVSYYNDSFSTNPTSAIAAVRSFDQPIVLFLGGFDKQANFAELAELLKTRKIRKIITYDKTGSRIHDLLVSKGVADVEYIAGDNFKAIIGAGVNSAQPGDIVLFSPACASWGMFSDYKARGQIFNDIITSI
jgi:UDP-N-acetylmuramoylalanine--D-glutamate ligase